MLSDTWYRNIFQEIKRSAGWSVFPVSVILFMCAINSAIAGYLVYKALIFTGEKKYAYLLYVPFLFFPVIDSNLYPMRMSIYAFLELRSFEDYYTQGSAILAALKVPLVFLTAPGTLFMYYYSPYLCGWILLFFVGILWIRKKDRKA